jgi:hypothetical protein
MRKVGLRFVTEWLASDPPAGSVASLTEAKKAFPRSIPQALDAELLARGRERISNPLSDDDRRELRRGFWDGVS